MSHQMTLDTLLNTTAPIKGMVDRYLMLDFLDRLKGETAFMRYEDLYMSFRLPFRFGMMQFSTVRDIKSNSEGDFPKLVRLSDPASQIMINHTWTGISETDDGYNAVYTRQDFPHNRESRITQGLCGKATFIRAPYHPQRPNPLPVFLEGTTVNMIKHEMTGKSVHFLVRTPDDWLQEMTSLPVKIDRMNWDGNTISFECDQGALLRVRGVTRVRCYRNYVLFDVYNESHGYGYSFYMCSTIDLYKNN